MQDILAKLEKYEINPDLKKKLYAVLSTVRIHDVKGQAFEYLFDRGNDDDNITPNSLKNMMLRILVLLTKPDVSKHISEYELKEYSVFLEKLFTFFDWIDNDDFDKMEAVNDILKYGEELPSGQSPYAHRNAQYLHDLYIDGPVKKITEAKQAFLSKPL